VNLMKVKKAKECNLPEAKFNRYAGR